MLENIETKSVRDLCLDENGEENSEISILVLFSLQIQLQLVNWKLLYIQTVTGTL